MIQFNAVFNYRQKFQLYILHTNHFIGIYDIDFAYIILMASMFFWELVGLYIFFYFVIFNLIHVKVKSYFRYDHYDNKKELNKNAINNPSFSWINVVTVNILYLYNRRMSIIILWSNHINIKFSKVLKTIFNIYIIKLYINE